MTTNTSASTTRREQRIESVAAIIADKIRSQRSIPAEYRDDISVWTLNSNASGWTYDVRWTDGEYVSNENWTRVSGDSLSDDDINKALKLAVEWTN